MAARGLFCPQCRIAVTGDAVPEAKAPACPVCRTPLVPPPAGSEEEAVWYFGRGQETAGPYSLTELQLLAAVGQLQPTDLVWRKSLSHRRAALPAPAGHTTTLPVPAAVVAPSVWALDPHFADSQFIPLNEGSFHGQAKAPQPTRQPNRTLRALGVVVVLVLALVGLKTILDRVNNEPLSEPEAQETPQAKARPAKATEAKAGKRTDRRPTFAYPPTPPGVNLSPRLAARSDDPPAPATGPVLARVKLTPGWATFGQVLPRGAAKDGLRVGDLPTQTDVKTRWPDGSIRFAIVTAKPVKAGTYAVTAGPASTGTFTPAAPGPVWVVTTIDGTKYAATLGDKGSSDYWLKGPLVVEARQIVAPMTEENKPHPFLRVLFDLRTYKDGQMRVDMTVENTLDLRGARSVTYYLWVGDGNQMYFDRAQVVHPYLTRWRHVQPLGLEAAQVTPDFEPVHRAHALPRYLPLVTNVVNPVEGPAFDFLGGGSLNPLMPDHGGRPELAPYPDWTARYLAHKNPKQGRCVLAHGDLAGSWPVHLRKPDGRLVTIDERPQFWLDPRADRADRPAGILGDSPLTPDVAHQPSLAYVPYLMTGDRYYTDEMAFWANYILLVTWQDRQYNARGGNQGLLYSHEVRGIGWGLRNLTDAAAYLPDGEPLKAYFAQKIANNLKWLDKYADDRQTPLGTMWEDRRPENQTMPPKVWIALWEQNYLAWAIDHAAKQGFQGGLRHRDRIAKFQLALFASGADYKREFGAPYLVITGEKDKAGTVQHYGTMEELFKKNFPDPATAGGTQFTGFFGGDARLMLMIGLENGWPGAKEAYDFLWPKIAVEPFIDNVPDLARRAGWAIALEPPKGKSRP